MFNQQTPDSSGRNFGIHLPKVAGGQHLQPKHINKISEMVEKTTVQSGSGYSVTQSPSGTQINIPKRHKPTHPWFCQSQGNWLTIDMGHFFMTGNSSVALVGDPAKTTFLTTTNRANEWLINNSKPWAASFGYPSDSKSNGLHMGSSEIWIDIEGANYLANTQMDNGYIPLSMPLLSGLYYLTIAGWSGRELPTKDDPSASVWNVYSKSKKGSIVPCIKYATLECMFGLEGIIYPICTVDESGYIFQGVSSDIFHAVADAPPFTVTMTLDPDNDEQYILNVVVGTVCNVVPVYEDEETYLWDEPTTKVTKADLEEAGILYVVIECTPKEEDEFSGGKFPEWVVVKVVKTVEEFADKDDAGYVVIALLRGRTSTEGVFSGVEVKQVVTGSLWAERRKYSDALATYFFFRMNTT